jgi:hypothetical protein
MLTLWMYSLPLLLVAGIVFWLMRQSPFWLRALVAGSIWPVLPLAFTLWILIVGDQMPPDAVIIDPATL